MDNLHAEKIFVEKGELLGALYDADAITMQGVGIINQFPVADVAPVQHGRWVLNDEYVLWAEKYVCSVCNCNAPSDGDYRHNLTDYCPNCGAKMDLE